MVTMSDIAAKVGVSRATVSFVLNGRQTENVRIPEATRQRILDATAELGYRPNQLAQSVALGKTRMIGYFVEEPRYEPYWATIIGALSEAEELGFTLKVLSVKKSTLEERLRQAIGLRLSGLIVRFNFDKSAIFEEANRAKIPVITVDEGNAPAFGSLVAADDASGCREAIKHLIHLGHRRIAFISSGFPRLNSQFNDIGSAREQLFRREMAQQKLDVPEGYVTRDSMMVYGLQVTDGFDTNTVYEATDSLLNHPSGRPTAIFCWRDETAMIAIRVCQERGLRVPEDISVVGFSNISAARFFNPSLSTVQTPWEEMGRLAVTQLLHRLGQDFDPTPTTHLVPTTFIARHSSGPVHHSN
ncbi:LacI family transcriptional regulator [bacterium]|nr:MAG: LacI family transcriptional regulator [bacterium]